MEVSRGWGDAGLGWESCPGSERSCLHVRGYVS